MEICSLFTTQLTLPGSILGRKEAHPAGIHFLDFLLRYRALHHQSPSINETRNTTKLFHANSRTYLQLARFSKMGLRVFNVLFITAVLMATQAEAVGMTGGLSQEKSVTPEVQAVIDSVRADVESQLGHPVSQFKGLTYKTQVVAGINYFVKVDIGTDDVVHIRVYHALDGTHTLSDLQANIPRGQPIAYF